MNKLQFDATKRFPWDDEDDMMAMMAWSDARALDRGTFQDG
jgi:hypothetical protein